MRFWALDFDGVICDSARENGHSAWRCAHALWPDEFPGSEAPAELLDGFCRMRPYLETGYQSPLMMLMLRRQMPLAAFSCEFEHHCDALSREKRMDRHALVEAFGAQRDRWIAADPAGWLASHGFYPGIIAALRAAQQRGTGLIILTTKQERFVRLLLQGQGLDFPAERIYGLERQRRKEYYLEEYLQAGNESFGFVEDRFATLTRVAAVPALQPVSLFFAEWGYSTPPEIADARRHARIRTLTLAAFTAMLTGGASA